MLIAFLLLTDYGESLNGKLCQLERPELSGVPARVAIQCRFGD
jgi:hypothetical protein